MESPFRDIDYERENQISKEFYNRGYMQGNQEGAVNLTKYLCGLSEEELIKWQKTNIALLKSMGN